MALDKRWTILERVDYPSDMNYRVALYAEVPVERKEFEQKPSATSPNRDISAAELLRIQSGEVVELITVIRNPVAGFTQEKLDAACDAAWRAFQDEVTSKNLYDRYGRNRSGAGTVSDRGVI